MQPTPAEIARTLAAGRLAGCVHIARRPGPYQVRHVTDPSGRVLLLVSVVSDLGLALRTDSEDVAMVLDVRDLPPAAGSPTLGRAWISGWAAELTGEPARAAALDFADVDPTGDLLDLGRGFTLYQFEAAEVRLERAGAVVHIDPDEYAAAEPDPLHHLEAALLADLADHHGPEIEAYVLRQVERCRAVALPAAGDPPPRVVRLDRYGFVVSLGPAGARYHARLSFPRSVRDHAALVDLLHPVLCRRAHQVGRASAQSAPVDDPR